MIWHLSPLIEASNLEDQTSWYLLPFHTTMPVGHCPICLSHLPIDEFVIFPCGRLGSNLLYYFKKKKKKLMKIIIIIMYIMDRTWFLYRLQEFYVPDVGAAELPQLSTPPPWSGCSSIVFGTCRRRGCFRFKYSRRFKQNGPRNSTTEYREGWRKTHKGFTRPTIKIQRHGKNSFFFLENAGFPVLFFFVVLIPPPFFSPKRLHLSRLQKISMIVSFPSLPKLKFRNVKSMPWERTLWRSVRKQKFYGINWQRLK